MCAIINSHAVMAWYRSSLRLLRGRALPGLRSVRTRALAAAAASPSLPSPSAPHLQPLQSTDEDEFIASLDRVIERRERPSAALYLALIRRSIDLNYRARCHSLYEGFKAHGFTPSSGLFRQLMAAFNAWEEYGISATVFRDAQVECARRGRAVPADLRRKGYYALVELGLLGDAHKELVGMIEAKIPLHAHHSNHILRHMLQIGTPARQCVDTLEELIRVDAPIDTVSFNLALAAAKRDADAEITQELLHRMRDVGKPRDTVTFNTAIRAYTRAGDPESALALWDELARGDCPPNGKTVACAIDALAARGSIERARKIFEEFRGAFANDPEIRSAWHALLNAEARCSRPSHVWNTMCAMKRDGVRVSLRSNRVLLQSCSRYPSEETSSIVEETMKNLLDDTVIVPDGEIFSHAIVALARNGKEERALHFARLASKYGHTITNKAAAHAVAASVSSAKPRLVCALHERILQGGWRTVETQAFQSSSTAL